VTSKPNHFPLDMLFQSLTIGYLELLTSHTIVGFNCSCRQQLQFFSKCHSASISENSYTYIYICNSLFIKVDPVMMLSSSITTTTRMFSVLSCKHTTDITWSYDHNRKTSKSNTNYIAITTEQNTKLDRRKRGQFAILFPTSLCPRKTSLY